MNISKLVDSLDTQMRELEQQVLEKAVSHETYLVMCGKYRGLKSVRDQLKARLAQLRAQQDPVDDDPEADDPPPEPRRRPPAKPRSW